MPEKVEASGVKCLAVEALGNGRGRVVYEASSREALLEPDLKRDAIKRATEKIGACGISRQVGPYPVTAKGEPIERPDKVPNRFRVEFQLTERL